MMIISARLHGGRHGCLLGIRFGGFRSGGIMFSEKLIGEVDLLKLGAVGKSKPCPKMATWLISRRSRWRPPGRPTRGGRR